MTILDKLFAFKSLLPAPVQRITNEEAEKLATLVKETHRYFYTGTHVKGGREGSYYPGIANAISCLYSNGGLAKKHYLAYNQFYRSLYFEVRDHLFKLRHYYERSKAIRKAQHSEILRLRAEVKRLKSGKRSRLEQMGDILNRFHNGTSLSKNCHGEWVLERHDGDVWRVCIDEDLAPAGLWQDPMLALKHLDKPRKIHE